MKEHRSPEAGGGNRAGAGGGIRSGPVGVPAPDGTFWAWLAHPARTPAPALLVLPEIYNANLHIRAVAEAFADAGYLALAPDVYWRVQPETFLPYTPRGQREARRLNGLLDVDLLLDDLGHACRWLRGRDDADGRVGAVGFCLGGKLAWLAAARAGVDAAVSYYGVRIEDRLDEAPAIRCPLLLHFAGLDHRTPPPVIAAIREAHRDQPHVALHMYEGADHGFNRAGEAPHHPEAARLAWERTLAHFGAALGGGG